jgi:predicted dinucleotide-binding enzyme
MADEPPRPVQGQLNMQIDVSVLGTGRMGSRLAAMFADAGKNVMLASRDHQRAARIVQELGNNRIVPGTYEQAVVAPAIVPAIFIRDGLFEALEPWRTKLSGKLLIDISNPFNEDYSDFITPWDSSGAEELARQFPDARIVGAFKNVFWAVFDDPHFQDGASDVLVVGDDVSAKKAFHELTEGTPFRYLDAGPLINARTVERLTMITGALGRAIGSYPRMNWRLLG